MPLLTLPIPGDFSASFAKTGFHAGSFQKNKNIVCQIFAATSTLFQFNRRIHHLKHCNLSAGSDGDQSQKMTPLPCLVFVTPMKCDRPGIISAALN
jgi:hypothetical protein